MKRFAVLIGVILLVGVVSATSTLHFNSNFTDDGGHTWTNVNSTVFNTSSKVFGAASGAFTLASKMSIDTPASDDFDFGSGDFTVDFWFNPKGGGAAANYGGVFSLNTTTSTTYVPLLILETAGKLKFYATSTGTAWDISNGIEMGAVTAETWQHFAVVRSGTKIYLFRNGTLTNEITVGTTALSSNDGVVAWGRRGYPAWDNWITGLIDEARVTKGVARWTSSFTPPTSETGYYWEYPTAGVFYWVCPDDLLYVDIDVRGAGGAGKGTTYYGYDAEQGGYWYRSGLGGSAGSLTEQSRVPVAAAGNYTIIVGSSGNPSTAFGYTGAAGTIGTSGGVNVSGGSGEYGVGTTKLSTDGAAAPNGLTGGIGGLGNGAAGGGAAGYINMTNNTYSGAGGLGAPGIVTITAFAFSGGVVPEFSADVVTGEPGTLVRFTDLSVIADGAADVTYNWSFGDGTYSSVEDDVVHVFSWTGSYDVQLTINSSLGLVTETKYSYINIVNEPTEFDLTTQPRAVQFHVQTNAAAAVTGANVTMQGTGTSTGYWEWVQSLLGISLDAASINETSMSVTTDSLGNCEFLVVPSAKYNVVVEYDGITYDTLTLTPHEYEYLIVFTPGTASSIKFIDKASMDLTGTPEDVTFHVTTFFGNPIADATISVVPVSTSSGSWDWFPQLLGIPIDEIALNSTTLTATTDSQGDATFLVLPTVKYNVTTAKAGYTFNTMYVTPNLRVYPIVATSDNEGFTEAKGTNNVSMTVSSAKINTTYGFINVTVLDTTSSITGGNIYVYRRNQTPTGAPILVDTMASVDNDFFDYSIVALNTTGTAFVVNGTMTSSGTPATVYRSVPVTFDGSPVEIGWIDAETMFYGCMIVLAVLMLAAGATSSLGVAAAAVLLGFSFLSLGWLRYFTELYGDTLLVISFTLVAIIVAFGYVSDYRRENR